MDGVYGTLIGRRERKLKYGQWYPTDEGKAIILLAHGYGEHMGRYKHVIEAFVKAGYILFAIDHRGHGQSEGLRADVESFDYFVDDLYELYKTAKECHPDLPIFLVGHSMGGLIATLFAYRHQDKLAGLVLSGPAILIGADTNPLLKAISSILARLVPTLQVVKPGNNILSRDPEVEALMRADTLSYTAPLRARMGNEMYQASLRAQKRLAEITIPVLIMHGTDDRLTHPDGSRRLYAESESTDKTLKLWDDMYHEIFNEIGKEEVLDYTVAWVNERVPMRVTA